MKAETKAEDADNETTASRKEIFGLVAELYGELSYAVGALSLHFSNQDDGIRRTLEAHGLYMFQTKVVSVDTNDGLKRAFTVSAWTRTKRFLKMPGERHILVRPGTYRVDPDLWLGVSKCLLVGDMSGEKPTFLIENHHPNILSENIFVNIHFEMFRGQLTLNLYESQVLFLNCSFKSDSPSVQKNNVKAQREVVEQYLKKILEKAQASNTAEDMEEKDRSTEDRNLGAKLTEASSMVNANPAVVVLRGRCAMIKCEIQENRGGGALVANHAGGLCELLLYMKSCTVRKSACSGVEARQYGSLILEDCDISDNQQGVLVWHDATNVMIKRSRIYNNTDEGIM